MVEGRESPRRCIEAGLASEPQALQKRGNTSANKGQLAAKRATRVTHCCSGSRTCLSLAQSEGLRRYVQGQMFAVGNGPLPGLPELCDVSTQSRPTTKGPHQHITVPFMNCSSQVPPQAPQYLPLQLPVNGWRPQNPPRSTLRGCPQLIDKTSGLNLGRAIPEALSPQ